MSRKVWIPVAVAVLVAVVAAGVWFFTNRTGDADSAARTQRFQTTTTTTTPVTSAASSTASMPSVSISTRTSSSMVPHLQPGQELTPTPISGLNVPIDGKTWKVYGPFDSGLDRMTKVNLTEIGGKPACKREVAMENTRVCPGFIVVDADQSPFYTDDKCLTIGGSNDPTYEFSRRLDDVRINGMIVERVMMTGCGKTPGVSFVWKFPLNGGAKVHVIEVGNDSTLKPSNPLPGLTELLDKVTAAG